MPEPNLPTLPFNAFAPQFDTLLMATGNLLDRSWPQNIPQHSASRGLVLGLFKASENTFRTIRFFAADLPEEPARKREFALSISPLARTILDALFTLVFLFGDLRQRTSWYLRAGWREIAEEHARFQARYAGDPEWQEWLKNQASFLQETQGPWGISQNEVANPKLINRWPIPGRMITHPGLKPDRKLYLQYLNDWFYRELSQDAHLSWPGLIRRSFALVPSAGPEERGWRLDKYKSDAVITTVILLLAIISELELELRFELTQRIKYVWGVIMPFSDSATEIYDHFYRPFFA